MIKSKKFIYAILIFTLSITSVLNAQSKFVAFELNYSVFPDSKLDDVDKRPLLEDVETQINNFKLQFAYPILGSPEKNTLLLAKASYNQLSFSFNNDSLPAYQPEKLHEIGIDYILRQRLNEKWHLTFRLKPILSSDLRNLDYNHVNFSSGILFSKSVNENMGYGFGVVYNNDFGEPLILPALLFNWTNGHNLKTNIVLPKMLEFIYLPFHKLELGVVLDVSGNHYRIGERGIVKNNLSVKEGRIKYSVTSFGLILNFGITDNIYITFRGSNTLKRRFEIFTKNDKEIDTLDLENSFSIKGGLQFRI